METIENRSGVDALLTKAIGDLSTVITRLAVTSEFQGKDITTIKLGIEEIRKDNFTNKQFDTFYNGDFKDLRKIVYGFIGLILTIVIGSVIYGTLHH